MFNWFKLVALMLLCVLAILIGTAVPGRAEKKTQDYSTCYNYTCNNGTVLGGADGCVVKNTSTTTLCSLKGGQFGPYCGFDGGDGCEYFTDTWTICDGTVPAGEPFA